VVVKVATPEPLLDAVAPETVPDPAVVEQSEEVKAESATDAPFTGLLFESSTVTAGWVPKAVPAVAELDGGVVKEIDAALPAPTATACEEHAVIPPPVAFR